MAIIAKQENESTFEPIPEGVHRAICYGIIDLGLQYSEKFDKKAHKVQILWELPDETFEQDGEKKPRVISKEYTLSLSEKSTLRKDLQAWRGKSFSEEELKGFDLKNVLNVGCQIQIIHTERNGKVYANIASIMGLPKSMAIKGTVNPLIYFDLSDKDAIVKLAELPVWLQDKIKASETYQTLVANEMSVDDSDVDSPF